MPTYFGGKASKARSAFRRLLRASRLFGTRSSFWPEAEALPPHGSQQPPGEPARRKFTRALSLAGGFPCSPPRSSLSAGQMPRYLGTATAGEASSPGGRAAPGRPRGSLSWQPWPLLLEPPLCLQPVSCSSLVPSLPLSATALPDIIHSLTFTYTRPLHFQTVTHPSPAAIQRLG